MEKLEFLNRWMGSIRPKTKLKDVVMPGTHNAGSYGMNRMACCQNHGPKVQIEHGVRFFCIRLNEDKKGEIRLAHGRTMGATFASFLQELNEGIQNAPPTELFLLDIREYYPQKFGPITFTYRADPQTVYALLQKHLNLERLVAKNLDIKTATLQDFYDQNARVMLINEKEAYPFSVSANIIRPWEKAVNGAKAENFIKLVPKLLKENVSQGLHWCELQQTPNFGTEIGIKTPKRLEERLLPHFETLIQTIRTDADCLAHANILCGDFMTEAHLVKPTAILSLNLDKGQVKLGHEGLFAKKGGRV